MQVFEKTYDPLTGITTTVGADDKNLIIQTEGDPTVSLEHTLKLRNDPEYSKRGIRADLWHTVHIPMIACLKMKMEDGFDVYSASARELRQFLVKNRDKYGYLFVTEGKL